MHIWLHKLEVLVDQLIPPLLAALAIVIVGELAFSHQFTLYRHYADWFDGFIVLVFTADLIFKYLRIRKMPEFVKKYWMEIIATIPFFLLFRVMEFFRVSDALEAGQAFAHEGAAAAKIEKEAAMILNEVKRTSEVTRTARIVNTFRAITRFPRLLRAAPFHEKPTGHHYPNEKKR